MLIVPRVTNADLSEEYQGFRRAEVSSPRCEIELDVSSIERRRNGMAQSDVQLNSQPEHHARQLKHLQLELQRKQVSVAALLGTNQATDIRERCAVGRGKIFVSMVDTDAKGVVVNKRHPGH